MVLLLKKKNKGIKKPKGILIEQLTSPLFNLSSCGAVPWRRFRSEGRAGRAGKGGGGGGLWGGSSLVFFTFSFAVFISWVT